MEARLIFNGLYNNPTRRIRRESYSRQKLPIRNRQTANTRKQEKEPVEFHEYARDYICRLINLQRHIPDRYKRIDRTAVYKSIMVLENQLDAYPYDTERKMRMFWRKHRYEIKLLLPSRSHSAFEKLLVEFEHYDAFTNQNPEVAIWQPIANALGKF